MNVSCWTPLGSGDSNRCWHSIPHSALRIPQLLHRHSRTHLSYRTGTTPPCCSTSMPDGSRYAFLKNTCVTPELMISLAHITQGDALMKTTLSRAFPGALTSAFISE